MKMTKLTQLLTLIFIGTTLYGFEDAIVIKKAKEKHLEEIATLTHSIFFDDLKPILLSGYANTPLVKAGETDTILNEWLTVRNKSNNDSINNIGEKTEGLIIAQDKTKKDILGFCNFSKEKINNVHYVYISFLAVNKQVRQRGIGTTLLTQAMNTFDDVTLCKLATLAFDNESVQSFYEKRGFTNQGLVTIDPRAEDTHFLYSCDIQHN